MTEEEFKTVKQRMEFNRCGITVPDSHIGVESFRPTVGWKRNKYGVSPKEERTVDGILFASKAEAKAYQELSFLQKSGAVKHIELQPVFKFPMGYEYRADFRVTYDDGTVEVIDVKGMETPVFKLKKRDMAYFYPDVKLSIWK